MGDFAIGPGLRDEIHGEIQTLFGARARSRSETLELGAFLLLQADLDASLSVRETVDMFDAAVRIPADRLPPRGAEPRWMLNIQVDGRILFGDGVAWSSTRERDTPASVDSTPPQHGPGCVLGRRHA